MSQYKNWLATWQSVSTFEQLPGVPGLVAIVSVNTQNDVIFTTHLPSLRQTETVECQFGKLVPILSAVLPDFRIAYWVAPPDNVVLAQLPTLSAKLQEETKPRLQHVQAEGTSLPSAEENAKATKALVGEVVEEDELMFA